MSTLVKEVIQTLKKDNNNLKLVYFKDKGANRCFPIDTFIKLYGDKYCTNEGEILDKSFKKDEIYIKFIE